MVYTTGDIYADIKPIQDFYANSVARYLSIQASQTFIRSMNNLVAPILPERTQHHFPGVCRWCVRSGRWLDSLPDCIWERIYTRSSTTCSHTKFQGHTHNALQRRGNRTSRERGFQVRLLSLPTNTIRNAFRRPGRAEPYHIVYEPKQIMTIPGGFEKYI